MKITADMVQRGVDAVSGKWPDLEVPPYASAYDLVSLILGAALTGQVVVLDCSEPRYGPVPADSDPGWCRERD